MKRLIWAFISVLLFVAVTPAQKRQTDREFDKLKGPVKTVVAQEATLTESSGKLSESERRPGSETIYDAEGNLVHRKIYVEGSLFDSTKYGRLNGDKISFSEDVESPNVFITDAPVGANKSMQPADPRYTYKFKYKYDDQGRVTEESWYQSNGSLWMRYVYKFKGNRREELAYGANGDLNQKYVYTLDDKGNEVEQLIYDTEKDSVESKETYQYVEFDSRGNWTKRIMSEGERENKFSMKASKATYRTITYF
ncbi:MAG TPA: hypothetical protein VJ715_00460 [Pyrinomonadaceae bacterium]|nr:hypothetical protein [Pyrinomonadaceae bacterium]